MRTIGSNFVNTDKSIIGRKFSGGLFFFPGFGSAVRMLILSSAGACSNMCLFDERQFDSNNLLLFTSFLTVWVDSRPRVKERLVS